MQDDLTGLPNRRGMAERLDDALARLRRDGGNVAVLLVDLDRFKPVNDLRGHAAGDRLLRIAARRPSQQLVTEEEPRLAVLEDERAVGQLVERGAETWPVDALGVQPLVDRVGHDRVTQPGELFPVCFRKHHRPLLSSARQEGFTA